MSRYAAVAAVLLAIHQPLEIACAAVRCAGSCGCSRWFPESPAKSTCVASAAVAVVFPHTPYALRGHLERAAGAWKPRSVLSRLQ
jgi:hypothetical protein